MNFSKMVYVTIKKKIRLKEIVMEKNKKGQVRSAEGEKSDYLKKTDEELQQAYEEALGNIEENDDENARDNLADYMNELREESEALK